jgi:hypothetical protein
MNSIFNFTGGSTPQRKSQGLFQDGVGTPQSEVFLFQFPDAFGVIDLRRGVVLGYAVVFFCLFEPGIHCVQGYNAGLGGDTVNGVWFGGRFLPGFDGEVDGSFAQFLLVVGWHLG